MCGNCERVWVVAGKLTEDIRATHISKLSQQEVPHIMTANHTVAVETTDKTVWIRQANFLIVCFSYFNVSKTGKYNGLERKWRPQLIKQQTFYVGF